jgi:hypothetical protein
MARNEQVDGGLGVSHRDREGQPSVPAVLRGFV